MKIEDRVRFSLEYASIGEFERALDAICPAIEATARKWVGKPKASSEDFKAFVRKYYFVLEPFSGSGLNMAKTKFPKLPVTTDGDREIADADIADLVYHCYRCATAHGHEISDSFMLMDNKEIGWSFNTTGSKINLPHNFIFGLIALVVFAAANSDLKTYMKSKLTWGTADKHLTFDIDLFWGGEELVRRYFEKFPQTKVTFIHEDRKP